jgi:hypothetical protein
MLNRVRRHQRGVTLRQVFLPPRVPKRLLDLTASRSCQIDSNTTSEADGSTGSRMRYPRHRALLLTRSADEERNLVAARRGIRAPWLHEKPARWVESYCGPSYDTTPDRPVWLTGLCVHDLVLAWTVRVFGVLFRA